jgi:parallel beta-helix repeat protein
MNGWGSVRVRLDPVSSSVKSLSCIGILLEISHKKCFNVPQSKELMRAILFLVLLLVSACLNAATLHYVDINNPNPVSPYTTWATAATNIQDAVDAAHTFGDPVLVTNGVYQTGSRGGYYGGLYRVVILNGLVQSVNGPGVTVIQGQLDPTSTNGPQAVGCVSLALGASLSGFTLTNGATSASGSGGGVVLGGSSSVISNCIVTGNYASEHGGGVYGGGVVRDTTISNNVARSGGGGAAYFYMMSNCVIANNRAQNGGGTHGDFVSPAVVTRCLIQSNVASIQGGGVDNGSFTGCTIIGNTASVQGGGANSATLVNCLVLSNSAPKGGGSYAGNATNCTIVGNTAGTGGGVYPLPTFATPNFAEIANCIVYYNSATNGANWFDTAPLVGFCCTTPQSFAEDVTNAPTFVDLAAGDFRLRPDSPCINAGRNIYITNVTDFAGNARIVGGTVDMGAYEYQTPASVISYDWLQQHGLATDGSADYADPDGDGFSNWQEWIAGTDPADASSLLRISSIRITPTNCTVLWPAVTSRSYNLQRCTNLVATGFVNIQTNLRPFQTNVLTATDATGTNENLFYRVQAVR